MGTKKIKEITKIKVSKNVVKFTIMTKLLCTIMDKINPVAIGGGGGDEESFS